MSGRLPPFERNSNTRKKKNPACLGGEQGSRKIDDLCQILNYLTASLVKSRFVEPRSALAARVPNPNSGCVIRKEMPRHRIDDGVVSECFEYVLGDFIGSEGIGLIGF